MRIKMNTVILKSAAPHNRDKKNIYGHRILVTIPLPVRISTVMVCEPRGRM